jgi:hypothetical protein
LARIHAINSGMVFGGNDSLPIIHNGDAASSEIGYRSRSTS